jgi:hypothetical protein
MDAHEQVRKRFMYSPDEKLGFVVYRCTYQIDEDWKKVHGMSRRPHEMTA